MLPVLVLGPLLAAAGLYASIFAYQLIAALVLYGAIAGVIGLYLLGLVSSSSNEAAALSVLQELVWSSDTANFVVGSIGALATLRLVTRTVMAAPEASSWRRAVRAGAVAVAVAGLAAGIDYRYGVTPYVERLAPRPDFAAAQREVNCPMSVAQLAQGDFKLQGCVTEVEGLLVYSEGPRRLELYQDGAGTPSIKVYFLLGGRTLFGATSPRLPPSYYDQVSEFVGKRVRIVGMAFAGHVRADIGHIVLADARPRTQ